METLFEVDSRGRLMDEDTSMQILKESLARNDVIDPNLQKFAQDLVLGVCQARCELDEIIQAQSEKWRLDRIGRVERVILRMALIEIDLLNTPAAVAIDEAVELAKMYASAQAGSFVNGVLGALVEND